MIRVVIRKPIHQFLENKANELGIYDFGEIVNYLLLKLIESSIQTTPPTTATVPAIETIQPRQTIQEIELDPTIERLAKIIDVF